MLFVAGSSTIAYNLLTNGGSFFFFGGAIGIMPPFIADDIILASLLSILAFDFCLHAKLCAI
jgi:hypothetical protein